jgi:hypothetical protein
MKVMYSSSEVSRWSPGQQFNISGSYVTELVCTGRCTLRSVERHHVDEEVRDTAVLPSPFAEGTWSFIGLAG